MNWLFGGYVFLQLYDRGWVGVAGVNRGELRRCCGDGWVGGVGVNPPFWGCETLGVAQIFIYLDWLVYE